MRNMYSILCTTLCVLVLFQMALSLEIEDFSSQFQSGRHLLANEEKGGTRSTWRGVKISDRICGMDENGNCHYMEYAEALSKSAAPGIILAVLTVITLIVFCCGRFICNCFGGRRRSKGFCCGKRDKFEGYSLKEVWIIKILLFATMLGIALCCIVGFTGNKSTSSGIKKTTTTLIDTGNTIIDKAGVIAHNLSSLPYTQNSSQQIEEFISFADGYLEQAESVNTQIDMVNGYRAIALNLSFALPLGLLVIGVIGAIFNWRWLAMFAFFFCFLVSIIIWISFGVHNLVETVLGDICFELDEVINGPPPANNNSTTNSTSNEESPNAITDAIKEIYYCTQFASVGDLARGALDSSYRTACDGLTKLCNDSMVNCSDSYAGGNCSRNNLEDFLDVVIRDYLVGCNDTGIEECPWDRNAHPCNAPYLCFEQHRTVKECASQCRNEQLREYANTTVYGLELLFLYSDIINNQVLPLLNCTIVQDTFKNVNDGLCVSIRGGTKRIVVASGFLGALLIPGTVLLILGFKRFRKNRFPIDAGNYEENDLPEIPTKNNVEQHQNSV